jgi:hypothetical protein
MMEEPTRPALSLRALVAEHVANIRRVGYSTVAVAAGECEPGWVYTVGLSQAVGGPELLTIGLPPRKAHVLIHAAALRVLTDDRSQPGPMHAGPLVTQSLPISPLRVSEVGELWRSSSDFFNLGRIVLDEGWGVQRWPTTHQLVWADRYGRFPDELPNGSPGRFLQPLLADTVEIPRSG